MNNKLQDEAAKINLTMIRSAVASDNLGYHPCKYRLYRFNSCGHTRFLRYAAVSANRVKCKECQHIKRVKEASEKDLEFIREPLEEYAENCKADYGLYKFKSCGHSKLIQASKVRKGKFKCTECSDNRIKQEATLAGLTIIRKADVSDNISSIPERHREYNLYQFKTCGHTQFISEGNVRLKNLSCRSCNATQSSTPSSVYLLSIKARGFEWLKLGVSNNIDFRKNNYSKAGDLDCKLLAKIDTKTGKLATRVEKEIHKIFKSSRLCPKLMKNYMTRSGFTECYPSHMEAEITKQMEAMLDG